MALLIATLLLSLLVGVSLGLFGGGGSILTVPILVYVAGQDPKVAIATSLLVVGVTSAAGAVSHARAGRVRWRTGLTFGAAGMAGAYGGGRLAAYVPGAWLLIAFGLMMALTAVAMLRGREPAPAPPATARTPIGRMTLEGLVIGAVTGLVGAGGGFLVVPALVLLGGVPMATAVGTSLVVVALKSGAGLLGYLSSTAIDWPVALAVTAAAIVGSVVAGRWSDRIEQDTLRRAFGWFVIAMAAVILAQQLHADLRDQLLGSAATWIALAVSACAAMVWWVRTTRRPSTTARAPGGDPDQDDTGPRDDTDPEEMRPRSW